MNLVKRYVHTNKSGFDTIELQYSMLHILSGNPVWFCRVWHKEWIKRIQYNKTEFGEAYGKNKFDAFKKAVKNLNTIK